jgi:chorismate dehydratase
VDVALAPVVAAFDAPGLTLVPEAAIASRGAVESVLLFCRETPQAARTVALDASSRTSADLVRVLYQGLWRGSPRFFHRPSDPDLGAVESDAVLLIGDPALCARWSGPPPVDLGEAWTRWTGLPFVFAVWLARSPEAAAAAAPVLRRAAAAGRARIDAIAAEAASSMGLPEPRLRRYLRESIRYDLGPGERAGMERFRELRSALPAPHFS